MAVDRSRKTVRYDVDTLEVDCTTAKALLEQLQRIIANYGEDVEIDRDPVPYSEGDEIVVRAVRLETEEEMAKRIAREERDEKIREAAERREFERLKAKFAH